MLRVPARSTVLEGVCLSLGRALGGEGSRGFAEVGPLPKPPWVPPSGRRAGCRPAPGLCSRGPLAECPASRSQPPGESVAANWDMCLGTCPQTEEPFAPKSQGCWELPPNGSGFCGSDSAGDTGRQFALAHLAGAASIDPSLHPLGILGLDTESGS